MSGARLTWLVTRRELREGLRGRRFVVSTLVLLLVLGGIVAAKEVFGKKSSVAIGVAGAGPAQLVPALDAAARPFDTTVHVRRYADAAAAEDAVAHRKVDAAFASGGLTLLVRSDSPATALEVASAAGRSAFLADQARGLGITVAQARGVLAPPYATVRVRTAGADTGSQGFAFGATIVLFIAVSIYGQMLLMSVVQEKANRIVEVLLAALRPRHLLAGKVAGIGLLGLLQIAILLVAVAAAGAAGLVHLPSPGRMLPLAVLWFVLGFALYAFAYAAAGALVSRVEDGSSAAAPISLVMVACYIGTLSALAQPDGRLATVLTLVPLSAPFIVASRAAVTTIPLWEYVASFALTLVAIWGFVRAGGRIYELGLLRSGPRIPFREALASLRR